MEAVGQSTSDPETGEPECKTGIARGKVRRTDLHSLPAHQVCDRPAASRWRMDTPDAPGDRDLSLHEASEAARLVHWLAGGCDAGVFAGIHPGLETDLCPAYRRQC